jgi:hypothetical protein
MASPPRVSVVLPVFNAEAFLGEAVESVLAQSLEDFELIAIDDGSTDASRGILESFAARNGRVRLFARENRGLAATLNEGIQRAAAAYVAIMNADDISLPERLATQAAFLDAHPAVAAVGSQTRLMLADRTAGPPTSLPESPAAIRSFLLRASALAHPAVMLRRQAVLDAGGYRPQIEPAEDYDLWLRLAERHDLANLPDVLLHYRVHAGQSTARAYEAVAIASLVAQAAARARRAGHPDPVAGLTSIGREVAEQLGITVAAISRHAIENALSRSETLLATGAPPAVAKEPLESLHGDPVVEAAPEFFAAAGLWLQGRVRVSEGRYAKAVPLMVKAAVVEPLFRSRLAGAPHGRCTCRRIFRGRWRFTSIAVSPGPSPPACSASSISASPSRSCRR